MRSLAVALAFAVLAISSARAQAPAVHPDFSGVWVMDTTKTQPGMQVDVSSILTWEGSTLIITSTLNAGGQEIHQVEKWSLDAGGQSLVADRNVEAMGQQYSMKLLVTKRP